MRSRVLTLGALVLPTLLTAQEVKRPNILMLMTDDQTLSSIAALGNSQVTTPNIDRLVREGVTFSNHYAATSISMASRAITMTGMYEYKTGVNFAFGAMTSDIFSRSYPVVLRETGYYTGFAGKFGFGVSDDLSTGDKSSSPEFWPIKEFDEWAGVGHSVSYHTKDNPALGEYVEQYPHATTAYAAWGRDFIDHAKESGKPFCLSLWFKAPHAVAVIDPRFKDKYSDVEFAKPVDMSPEWDSRLPLQAKLGRQYLYYVWRWFGENMENYQHFMREYHQLIYGVDYALGMLVDKLKAEGLDDNTIIIFTSDNGFSLGSRNLGGKVLPYEMASRIPLVILDPRNRDHAGMKVYEESANIDIAPTIIDLAGAKAPNCMDGESLVNLMRGESSDLGRDDLSLINVWAQPQCYSLSIIADGVKYIYWCFDQNMEPSEELYNLRLDPLESKNLANDPAYKTTLKEMRKRYDERLRVWDKEGVKDRSYHHFPAILSRYTKWNERKELIPEVSWKSLDRDLKVIKYSGDKADYEEIIKYRKQ